MRQPNREEYGKERGGAESGFKPPSTLRPLALFPHGRVLNIGGEKISVVEIHWWEVGTSLRLKLAPRTRLEHLGICSSDPSCGFCSDFAACFGVAWPRAILGM